MPGLDIKGKNLIEEFGSETGFWQLFAEVIKEISVNRKSL